MAPKALEDDFVLTISDNDELTGSEEDFDNDPAPSTTSNKKRKRDTADNQDSVKNKKTRRKETGFESTVESRSVEEAEEPQTWADGGEDDGALASDFEFQIGGAEVEGFEEFDGWGLSGVANTQKKGGDKTGVDIDDIIARRQQKSSKSNANGVSDNQSEEDDQTSGDEDNNINGVFEGDADETLEDDAFGVGIVDEESGQDEEDSNDSADEADTEEDSASDAGSEAAPVAHPDDLEAASEDEASEEDSAEAERRAAFFAPEEPTNGSKVPNATSAISFQSMNLSRPIMKGLTAVGFTSPTPIQAKTIPVALAAKDVVGGAVTGSGKTGAFIIPILERLLYRPKKVSTTRVAILMPTRELAVQCFNVTKKLASFTDITTALIVGGLSLREQETTLRSRPDIIIATPGRFIDHMRNSASFTVDSIEILVLDEADRMLEDGFADELNEILTTIPKSRQTMLFSATMTDSVDKLIRVGLKRPVRLMVDAKRQTVKGLVQEFVRLRPGREDKRLAYLMWLCENIYSSRVIIFFRQKKEAHRVRVVFGLCGLKAAELHGSMSQEQRLRSVEAFRAGSASFLLATDLASRGLDIKGVDVVINYEAPQSHEIYLHRVGRTARAGRSGRSCTIAAEPDRKVVKAAVKSARTQGAKISSRIVPLAEADAWDEKLKSLEDDIEAVLKEEKEERALTQAERDVRKGENIVEHQQEIMSRPKRTWFESEKEKIAAKKAGFAELNAGLEVNGHGSGKKKGKLSNKEKKRMDIRDERKDGREWKKGKADTKTNSKMGKKGPKTKSSGRGGKKPGGRR